jgi:hypothetical protein
MNKIFFKVKLLKKKIKMRKYMGRGKNYFIFLPQSWIDIFVLWYSIKMEMV